MGEIIWTEKQAKTLGRTTDHRQGTDTLPTMEFVLLPPVPCASDTIIHIFSFSTPCMYDNYWSFKTGNKTHLRLLFTLNRLDIWATNVGLNVNDNFLRVHAGII